MAEGASSFLPSFQRPDHLGVRKSVLVVDDEPPVIEAIAGWAAPRGWDVVPALSSAEALKVVRTVKPPFALVDYRLQEAYEGIRLGRILRRRFQVTFALMSGYLTTGVVVEAMRAGAVDVLDKPLTEGRVTALLERLVVTSPETWVVGSAPDSGPDATTPAEKSTVARWAHLVLRACRAPEDPRTVALWGAAAGASEGRLDEICRIVGVRSRDARDLARVLRAIARSRQGLGPLASHFHVGDERTLRDLFDRAGLSRSARTATLQELFARQRFITNRACLAELCHLAANSPLFF